MQVRGRRAGYLFREPRARGRATSVPPSTLAARDGRPVCAGGRPGERQAASGERRAASGERRAAEGYFYFSDACVRPSTGVSSSRLRKASLETMPSTIDSNR